MALVRGKRPSFEGLWEMGVVCGLESLTLVKGLLWLLTIFKGLISSFEGLLEMKVASGGIFVSMIKCSLGMLAGGEGGGMIHNVECIGVGLARIRQLGSWGLF
ncbi:hypothetical protein SLE2022_129090 [Rubroshorea leprosula]